MTRTVWEVRPHRRRRDARAWAQRLGTSEAIAVSALVRAGECDGRRDARVRVLARKAVESGISRVGDKQGERGARRL